MYSITRGYVKSQEDTKFVIQQISDRESVYQVRGGHWSFGREKSLWRVHFFQYLVYMYLAQQINYTGGGVPVVYCITQGAAENSLCSLNFKF